ncbi:MAG: tRNA (N(6)-L-threonylcarbamoyladenosine(37)-C(2))-methylthiotransferase MtaB [Acholeplasmatales bacterium]|nr:tRNA (N(6)-L-threonylcarbamoyladenosine(37)-C(2))-methylthiotransferase MtaB [Acholeplasmatales bacterium]
MNVGFITLGCKVNIYESNALKEELTNRGHIISENLENCDCYIINTCSVTNMADAKSRKMIRKCVKMNPNAIICAIGCYAQTNPEVKDIDGVDIILGNGNKSKLIDLIEETYKLPKKSKKIDIIDILEMNEYEKLSVTTYDHTRAFVKIEDGCENFCTYCIIPYARGPVRCKNADSVIDELRGITEKGYKEVVLAGIHTGRYNDNGLNLSGLIKRILKEVPLIKRLRLSSIEINEIDDEFIELMRNNEILANHLHLPLQSGSDLVLEKMERRYDVNYFVDKINKIRGARPDISITTDIIVGFPYETENEFMETYNLAKELRLSKIHVFPYSMRHGTKAASFPQVNDTVKKNRATRLIELSKKLEEEYAKDFVGKELSMIIEQKVGNDMIGHTSNFLQVILPYDEELIKKEAKVLIKEVKKDKIYGEIIEIL